MRIAAFVLHASLIAPSLLAAEMSDLVDNSKPKEVRTKDGWDFLLTPGLSVSFSDNRSVIGQTDGYSITLGAALMAGVAYRLGDHQASASLNINESFSRTPVIEDFVKSSDIFKLNLLYLYDLLDWLGPYANMRVGTNLLEGFAVRPAFARWTITRLDGTVETRTARKFRLTDGFMPADLRESIGFFASPLKNTELNLTFRLGFGALELLADHQFTIADLKVGAPDQIAVKELSSFSQGGIESALELFGELYEKKIVYKLTAELLIPVINDLSASDDRNAIELADLEVNGTVSFKLLEWLSLDYVLRLVRVPQLLDEFQLQNNLLLTASWSLLQPEKDAG